MNKLETVKHNLEERGFITYIVENQEEAIKKTLDIVPKNSTFSSGGSMTIANMGLLQILKKHTEHLNIESEEKDETNEFFFSSANALTLDGQIVNTDGRCNRIANTIYGPENVIFLIGKNKIVDNLDLAFKRIEEVAVPLNLRRLNKLDSNTFYKTKKDICRATLIMHAPARGKKVSVILINEDLGY